MNLLNRETGKKISLGHSWRLPVGGWAPHPTHPLVTTGSTTGTSCPTFTEKLTELQTVSRHPPPHSACSQKWDSNRPADPQRPPHHGP